MRVWLYLCLSLSALTKSFERVGESRSYSFNACVVCCLWDEEMKNFQGKYLPSLKGFLENRQVNIPPSRKSLGYTCALFCVLMEIFVLRETVFVLGLILTFSVSPRGSSSHTPKAYKWNWCFPGGTWPPWAGVAVFSVFGSACCVCVSGDKAVVRLRIPLPSKQTFCLFYRGHEKFSGKHILISVWMLPPLCQSRSGSACGTGSCKHTSSKG